MTVQEWGVTPLGDTCCVGLHLLHPEWPPHHHGAIME